MRDLVSIAQKIGDNLKTLNRREETLTDIRRGIEIYEDELTKLEKSLVNSLTDKEIENAPSVDKIFLKTMEESGMKVLVAGAGKYQLYISDGYRGQTTCERFKTLKDAVKIARKMHSKLCKVSRHIEVTVETRRMNIDKNCFRADEWITFFEIDQCGNEKIKRRETVNVIAELDNRTVEEVQSEISSYGDNYGVYTNTALKSAEKKALIGRA